MSRDEDGGWAWFEAVAPVTQAATDDDVLHARCFGTPEGQRVLDKLRAIAARAAPMGCSSELLHEHEGARRLALNIINSVKRGQS